MSTAPMTLAEAVALIPCPRLDRRNRWARRAWRRLKYDLRAALEDPHCHLCGSGIDLALRAPDPGALTWDHVVPLALGGDLLDPGNVGPAHKSCNEARGIKQDRAMHARAARDEAARMAALDAATRVRMAAVMGIDLDTVRHVYTHQLDLTPEFLALRDEIDARILTAREGGLGLVSMGRALGLGISKAGRGQRRCKVLARAVRRAREAREAEGLDAAA